MALKGKTTIQLFDATTGEEVLNVEDENMVTDAVSSLCNNASKYFVQNVFGAEYEFDFVALTGKLIDSMFSGLMLFDENIPENKNTFFPSQNATMVGKAKKLDNPNDRLTGVLNQNETETLDNGMKYVWDFSTNKGNGQIKTVCLTSAAGGYCGTYCYPKTDYYSSIGTMYPIQAPSVECSGSGNNLYYNYFYNKLIGSSADQSNSFSARFYYMTYVRSSNLKNKSSYLIGVNSDGNFVYATSTTGANLVTISVYDYKKEKSRSFGLKENSYSGKYSENVLNTVTLTSDVATFALPLYWKTIDQTTYSMYIDGNKKLNVVAINLDTLTITKQISNAVQDTVLKAGLQINGTDGTYIYTINVDSSKTSDGKYKGLSIYKINIDDFSDYKLIQITPPTGKSGTYPAASETYVPFYANDVICVKSLYPNSNQLIFNITSLLYGSTTDTRTYNQWFYFSFNIKDETLEYYGYYQNANQYGILKTVIDNGLLNPIQAPDCPICLGHKGDSNVYYSLPMMFLSTINNLSTPVVKNETQTMKVTYEITEV